MEKVHVVFGAGGALGSALVRRLVADGRPVRAVAHNPDKAAGVLPPETDIVSGGARSLESARIACRDAGVIYHCVNVPYHHWDEVMPEATDNILAGARSAEALLVFPGNVYGYGPFGDAPAAEDHPRTATSHKGQLRNHLEKRLMLAHRAGECRVVIPRFPDFYGPNVTNRFFGAVFEDALAGHKVHWLGGLDAPHSLLFVEDAAVACVQLADRKETHGEVWHVPGPEPLTGREFLRMVLAAAGSAADVGAWHRGALHVTGMFQPEAREMIELMDLFEKPMVLDGTKFAAAFPEFRYTSHEVAIHRTVDWFRSRMVMEDEWRLLPERGHISHA